VLASSYFVERKQDKNHLAKQVIFSLPALLESADCKEKDFAQNSQP